MLIFGMRAWRAMLPAICLLTTGCSLLPSAPGGDGGVADLGLTPQPPRLLGILETDAPPGGKGEYWKELETARLSNIEKIGLSFAKSDALCNEYFADVSKNERAYLTSLDVMDTLFNFAGLLADGAGAKNLWVAYATASDGLAADVKTNVLRNNEATILMSAIRKRRKILWDELRNQLKPGGDLHGLDFALLLPEIERYHSSCTIANAIAEIQASVNTAVASASPASPPAAPTQPAAPAAAPAQPAATPNETVIR